MLGIDDDAVEVEDDGLDHGAARYCRSTSISYSFQPL